ncbi:MAG TPA: tetratricopeptide repeat protein [Polyangia bacterium]|nr:tetratricopeptide repeat protein [Polyangia bacterium]
MSTPTPPADDAPSAARWLALPLLVGTMVAYWPALHAGIVWDDRSFIMDNALIHRADGLWRFWFTTRPVDYYPVTSTLWWLEWRLWGDSPLGYHAVNVLVHAADVLLIWRLLVRLAAPGAWLAAALFAVHPVNVESVAWIAEGKNVLAMFFYLISLSCFVRSPAFGDDSSWGWYGLSVGSFLLALLSKTVVAPMPFVLLILLWWKRGRLTRADALAVAPFFVLAAGIGAVAFWFQAHRAIGAEVVRPDGFPARLAGAGWAIWFYLDKALLPLGLRSIYPRWRIDPRDWWAYLPALVAAGVVAACWRRRGTWGTGPLVAFAYFIVMLSPVLGFMDIAFMKLSLVADHWQYFAMLGPVALAAAALATTGARGGPYAALAALAGLVLVAMGISTWRLGERYRDAGTFWSAVLADDRDAWGAHNNLGAFLLEHGRPDEALAHFTRAVALRPDYAKAQYNLGALLRETGRLDAAVAHLAVAVRLQPDYVDAQNGLARALAEKGDWDGALAHLESSLALDPDQAEAHNNLANVLRQKGQLGLAAAEYGKALAIHPDYAAAHFNLGEVLRAQGDLDGAIAHYQRALTFRPRFGAALHSLAAAYAEAGRR